MDDGWASRDWESKADENRSSYAWWKSLLPQRPTCLREPRTESASARTREVEERGGWRRIQASNKGTALQLAPGGPAYNMSTAQHEQQINGRRGLCGSRNPGAEHGQWESTSWSMRGRKPRASEGDESDMSMREGKTGGVGKEEFEKERPGASCGFPLGTTEFISK